jgi:hypothetical protein
VSQGRRSAPHRLAGSLLALAAILGVLAGSPSGAGAFSYVAMGDSYSAASGVLPPDLSANPFCLRSIRNYPHVIARELDAGLTDVTCGAAETVHYFEPQYQGVPPQLDALSENTRLVTMTIGGNDNGVFFDAVLSCGSAGLASMGRGSPCQDRYGSSFVDTVREETSPALVKALNAVQRKAPHATVAILGYPWIMPKEEGCFPVMPVATGDVPYLRHLQWTLNDAIRGAAAETDTHYVNLSEASDGHDACQPAGVRWVEPVVTTTNPVIVHPNALGEAKMAAQAIQALDLD